MYICVYMWERGTAVNCLHIRPFILEAFDKATVAVDLSTSELFTPLNAYKDSCHNVYASAGKQRATSILRYGWPIFRAKLQSFTQDVRAA